MRAGDPHLGLHGGQLGGRGRAVVAADHRITDPAGELGRDALHDLAAHAAVAQHPVFRLPEHVDKAGRHHQATGVEASHGGGGVALAHRRDAAASHTHIRRKPRRPRAIHDAPTRDQQVAQRGQRRRGR
jgi:hypothetical protein